MPDALKDYGDQFGNCSAIDWLRQPV